MFQGLFLYRERYSLQICPLFRTKCVFNSSRTAKGRQFHVRFVLAPICVVGGVISYLCYLHLFTYTGAQHNFHIRWCLCRLTGTRLVSHVEQELLTLPERRSSPVLVFSGVRVVRSLVFCVIFCRSLFVLLSVIPSCTMSVIALQQANAKTIFLSVHLSSSILSSSILKENK